MSSDTDMIAWYLWSGPLMYIGIYLRESNAGNSVFVFPQINDS
jgi:hypothetical protein